jgi:uncharacterized membrane protein YphA (DoxX/SURF4 family)
MGIGSRKTKMITKNTHTILTYVIALVWIINGLFCKVLNYVPRHQEIVASILGAEHSQILTILIGFSEILMAMWIISKIKSRLNAILQITIVAAMNILEFILVPDLLLWGRFNAVFALLFLVTVYFNEFYLNKKLSSQT